MGVDVEADALRASVRSRLFGETAVSTLGRYQLQRQIGRGGMGVVYAALDPELGRTVALKVLRPRGTGGSQQAREARLVREARALARLSHPNVVSVYAVERIGGVLCIAMEFVRGETLAAWLTAQHRTDAAIVSAFVDAARGLAAAHSSGIVHRDFKPLNVMVGASEDRSARGRVRVLDFGLALTDPLSEETTSQDAAGSFESGSGTETQTGTVMGTRGYMAPELRDGAASPASDQYAFFISLFGALTQRGPKDPPLDTIELARIPGRLRPVLRRGLAKDPTARWPDLNDAADALLRATAPRWPIFAATAGTALALAGVAWVSTAHAEPDPCAAFDARVQSTWSDARVHDIETTLQGAPTFAVDAWARAAPHLEASMTGLRERGRLACTAAYDGSQLVSRSDAASVLCLQTQLVELDAALVQFEAEPQRPQPLDFASFDPLHACEEKTEPSDAGSRAFEEALAAVRGQLRAGSYTAAHTAMQGHLREVHSVSSASLRADAFFLGGRAAKAAGDYALAETRFQAALGEASTAGTDEVAARTWVALLDLEGRDFGRQAEAKRMLVPASAAVARLPNDARLQADFLTTQAMLADRSAEPERAIELLHQALAIVPDAPETAARRAHVLHALARALRRAGRPADSMPHAREALRLTREVLGPNHPEVGHRHIAIGTAANLAGDGEAALSSFDEALRIYTEALGAEHPSVAVALHDRGTALAGLGRVDDAYDDIARAAELDRVNLGADNPGRAQSLYTLAMLQRQRGNADDAQRLMNEALQVLSRAWGDEHPDLSYVIGGLADLAAAGGEFDEATKHYRRAQALLEPALGASHPRMVYPLLGEGRVALKRGTPEAALAPLERARSIALAGGVEPITAADVSHQLALAHLANDGAVNRVRELHGEARAACESMKSENPVCAEVVAWIAP